MSARHLAARAGILCPTVTYSTRTLYATACLSDMTCSRCIKRLALMDAAESDSASDRRRLARTEAACRTVGIGHLWDALAAEVDTDSRRLVRDLLGAVAGYFAECGVITAARQENAA